MGFFSGAGDLFGSVGDFFGSKKAGEILDNVGATTNALLDDAVGAFAKELRPFIDQASARADIVRPTISSLLTEFAAPSATGLDPSTEAIINQRSRDLVDQFASRGLSRSGELLESLNRQNTEILAQREPGLKRNRLATLLPFLDQELNLGTQISRTGLDTSRLKAQLNEERGRAQAAAAASEKAALGDVFGSAAKAFGGSFKDE